MQNAAYSIFFFFNPKCFALVRRYSAEKHISQEEHHSKKVERRRSRRAVKLTSHVRVRRSRPPVLLYSGGMPRASYGDRHCLTIQQGKDHVTLDFTSRVIDFFTVHGVERENGRCLRRRY